MPKEQYMCQLCANHGIFNQPKKGHKQKCLYRSCTCNLCALNSKRRALDQMERQLKQTEEVRLPTYSESQMLPQVSASQGPPPMPPSTMASIFPPRSVASAPYCVPLRATKRDYCFLKNETPTNTTWTETQQKTLDTVLEQIGRRSIFHSAEQLAG